MYRHENQQNFKALDNLSPFFQFLFLIFNPILLQNLCCLWYWWSVSSTDTCYFSLVYITAHILCIWCGISSKKCDEPLSQWDHKKKPSRLLFLQQLFFLFLSLDVLSWILFSLRWDGLKPFVGWDGERDPFCWRLPSSHFLWCKCP